MKLKVKIGDTIFDVDVGDLNSRPIIAMVNDEVFEVWPESLVTYTADTTKRTLRKSPEHRSLQEPKGPLPEFEEDTSAIPEVSSQLYVRAPIPGVITSISVRPNSDVVVGQELCKLEAMKMNNSIRASKAGRIRSIHISVGQTVKHNEIIMEYEYLSHD